MWQNPSFLIKTISVPHRAAKTLEHCVSAEKFVTGELQGWSLWEEAGAACSECSSSSQALWAAAGHTWAKSQAAAAPGKRCHTVKWGKKCEKQLCKHPGQCRRREGRCSTPGAETPVQHMGPDQSRHPLCSPWTAPHQGRWVLPEGSCCLWKPAFGAGEKYV